MHEISLVQNLLGQLDNLVRENGRKKVTRVTMEIGVLSGVVIDSFQFGFNVLTADHPVSRGAELEIVVPPVHYSCTSCTYTISTRKEKPERCPQCGETVFNHSGSQDLVLLQVELE